MDERLHRLVDTADGLVNGMLESSLLSLETDKVVLEIIVNLCSLELAVILVLHGGNLVDLLFESLTDVRREIEVERRYRLTSVHLVLDCLHGDTSKNGGCFYPLCGAGLAMSGFQSVLENEVERVLDTSE